MIVVDRWYEDDECTCTNCLGGKDETDMAETITAHTRGQVFPSAEGVYLERGFRQYG